MSLVSRLLFRRVVAASSSSPLATSTSTAALFHSSPATLAPRVTAPAPDFKAKAVVDGAFKDVCLSDYKGRYLVLYFYPLDFTFVCPTEIIAFSDR